MISVHVVADIIGNILNIPRDVGSHTKSYKVIQNIKCLVFSRSKNYLIFSLHFIFRADIIIKQAKSNILNVIKNNCKYDYWPNMKRTVMCRVTTLCKATMSYNLIALSLK